MYRGQSCARNMHNGASNITEASEAGVPHDDIISGSGSSDPDPRKEIMQDVYKREGAAALVPDNLESSEAASRKSRPVLCSVTLSVIGDKSSWATMASP
jgi:hypothetical protein